MASSISLRLPDELKALLAAQAEAEGKSLRDYIVEALAEKAARVKRMQEYEAEDQAALQEYERTGIAYSMEDVHEYFIAIAAGRRPARPKPIKR